MELKIKNRDGNELSAVLNRPEGSERLAVLCHGFSSSKDTKGNLFIEKILLKKGMSVLRYDFMGCGDSYATLRETTTSQAVSDFLDVMDYVHKLGWVKSLGVYGSSFGGLTVILGVAKYKGDVQCLALKSPASDWAQGWKDKLGKEGIQEWKKNGWTGYISGNGTCYKIGYQLYEDLQGIDAFEAARKIECPVLIVHGTKDESVPLEDSKKLTGIMKDATLEIIEGADHRFTTQEHFEKAHKTFAEWFEKHL